MSQHFLPFDGRPCSVDVFFADSKWIMQYEQRLVASESVAELLQTAVDGRIERMGEIRPPALHNSVFRINRIEIAKASSKWCVSVQALFAEQAGVLQHKVNLIVNKGPTFGAISDSLPGLMQMVQRYIECRDEDLPALKSAMLQ